jgi:hypothetical protein
MNSRSDGDIRAQPAIFEFRADEIDSQAIHVENYAIVGRYRADFSKHGKHGLLIGIAKAEKIEIARRAEGIFEPGRHEHRALEDEAIAMLGGAEAVDARARSA